MEANHQAKVKQIVKQKCAKQASKSRGFASRFSALLSFGLDWFKDLHRKVD